MSGIRRGAAAIQEAAEGSGQGGTFRPFLPSIYWKDDKEERYVLFLTEVEEIPTFEMIQFIKTENGYYQETVSKTDPFFGERSDPFIEEWDARAARRSVAIAVELEPVIEVVNGRRKPKGFEVKTIEYERKIVDEDGEATDETEEVTTPAIGSITQSPTNFYNGVINYDANDAPIASTALKITRLGKDKSTSYAVVGYDEQPIDLTNLVAYVDGISYLSDEMDEVVEKVATLSPEEAATYIGKLLLDKREEELLDDDRYQELLEGVTESMDIYGDKKKGKKGKSKGNRVAARRSQRREREVEPDEEPEVEQQDAPEEKPKPAAKAKASKKAEAKTTPQERMDKLRERANRTKVDDE